MRLQGPGPAAPMGLFLAAAQVRMTPSPGPGLPRQAFIGEDFDHPVSTDLCAGRPDVRFPENQVCS